MLEKIEDTLHKKCLIGLTYFNVDGEQLKQTLLAGTVKSVDKEMGITLILNKGDAALKANKSAAEFILPADISCWFTAPKGDFHTSVENIKVTDPDFLITWDIYQTKAQKTDGDENGKTTDGEQQWWQWRPRTQQPQVG
jgi:hypothetical protein